MTEQALNAITDKVLSHRYQPGPLKVIAGTSDTPLRIGDLDIPCYVLEDETRVLSQRGVFEALGVSRGGGSNGGAQTPRFAASKSLQPFMRNDLTAALSSPILFQPPQGGRTAYGYPAEVLVDICKAVLQGRDAGALDRQQATLARRAEMLIQGFATVGVIALVDEATGYQRIREERALATILERFMAAELQSWTRTFDYEFYEQIFRLKDWGSPDGVKRPRVIGIYTNDVVYERIAPGVLDELRQVNPTLPQGWRKNRHHQWFTPEFGHPKLKEHLAAVIALMRAASSWDAFKRSLDRALPKIGNTIPLALDDE